MKTITTIYSKYKQIIPTAILLIICVTTIVTYFQEEDSFILNAKHYGGFIAVIICLISLFVFRPYYKYILTLTLFLGFLNLINFTPSLWTVFMGFGKAEIGFQPTSFYIIVLVYFMNFKRSNQFIINQLQTKNFKYIISEEGLNVNKIDKFKERYKEYPDNKLQQILIENEFVPEALEAARQILNYRKIK